MDRPVEQRPDPKRLRHRADFLATARGPRSNGKAFAVQARRRDDDGQDNCVRVGFTVTKKVGNAPERNRVKRRLRELVRTGGFAHMQPHHDYVIVGRRDALSGDFSKMASDLATALHRVARSVTSPT